MSISKYIDLITSQHKVQPKFIAWLSSPLNIVNDGINQSKKLPDDFDIDKAIGVQLDTLGEIIGRSRYLPFQPTAGISPVLDDENYRIALKAKIAQNQWDGTIPQIYEIWESLFDDVRLMIVDNQNMTMAALIEGTLSTTARELVASGLIIPKPAGVGLQIIEVTDVDSQTFVGGLVTGTEIITIYTNTPA
ncbi:DUF2612 domain-containing protein [Paenibacillus filicis]|uniref:DUF2612 domain-containing protein n=1 Tax=Paenibacillus filicis TaxID=669464 RepID=A0ABU9DIP4_9BACL